MNLAISRVLIWKMSKIFSLVKRGAACAQYSEFVTACTSHFCSCRRKDFLNLPLNSFIGSLAVRPSKMSDVGLSFLGALHSPCYAGCEGDVRRFQTVTFQTNLFLMASNSLDWVHNISTNNVAKR